jgi:signal peptidase II
MVTAGAAGNIIDSMSYGLIFTGASPHYVSYFVPFGQGYAPFLMGKVVDMFYFPLIESTFPDWFPIWGGEDFIFFSPVFNFADACVSVGVVAVLLFYQKELTALFKDEKTKGNAVSTESEPKE